MPPMACSVAWRGSAKNGDLTHRRRRHLQQCVALLAERYQCVACSGLDHTQIVAAENEVPLKQLDKVRFQDSMVGQLTQTPMKHHNCRRR